MSGFVHLHLHTEYSLLDGATRISSIADKALALGQSAVAITDHGTMYGVVEFYNALRAKGVKPIIGCEVYVAARGRLSKEGKQDISGHHLILLCKNEVGYRNLCYMVSESFINGFYSKPRVDMELLRDRHEGLVCLSGCLAGKIPQLILAGSMEEAERAADELYDIFADDFYLEVQNHSIEDERKVAYGLRLISRKLGIPMVATNDVHYLEKSDAELQATLLCIQTGNVITDGVPFGFENDEFYFKSTDEMSSLFVGFEGAIENTVKIAEKCDFDFKFNELHLPDFRPEDDLTHAEKLRKDAYLGFEKKISEGRFDFSSHTKEEYLSRIEYELSVIDKMGFNAYFLIVADFVAYAKSQDIPVGPGRGSGAGSLVAFCIGITDVDPIAFDLLFERFLNPERVSMPDFDIDFCYTRREEVIEYVKRRYGDDKVAQIVTFGTLAARAAVRDVGRALGMPYSRVDMVAKLIPREMNVTVASALESKELKKLYYENEDVQKLLDMSMAVEGMPRHASTHAAGVVITEKPTCEYVPLSYSGTGVVTQFDMTTDAKLGLVKFDFLGLRYLTVIHDAEQAIRERVPDFSVDKIPLNDELTFRLLRDAKTDGVFQLESGGMKQVLMKLAPNCLEDIIACIALYRPGPMDSIDTFIARKHGREKTVYKIPELKSILDVTYGCIVYQEQVMQICRLLAGYSYARADIVRRAMSKKQTDAMKAEKDAFISGCEARGISSELASEMFGEMLDFAKYAFNKSHATAYGVISYRTAYLKAHYPAEYFAALLTSVLDNATKVKEYIADAQRFGVSVLPPDINLSRADFSVVDGNIRFGLTAIRNVGGQFASAIVKVRENGVYKSFDDFVSRLGDCDLNKRTVEALVKCGVFDSLGITRRALVASYENIIESEHARQRSNITGQMDIFSAATASSHSTSYEYPDLKEYSLKELLLLEKESSGMYFSGHMIDHYSDEIDKLSVDRISDLISAFSEDGVADSRYTDRAKVRVAGIVNAKKTKVTKNGDTMAFVILEDRYSEIEVIVFARQYAEFSAELFVENAVVIEGNVSVEDGDVIRIILSSAKSLGAGTSYMADEPKTSVKEAKIYVKLPDVNDRNIGPIYRIANFNRGNAAVIIFNESTKKYVALKGVTMAQTDKVKEKLTALYGDSNVVFK